MKHINFTIITTLIFVCKQASNAYRIRRFSDVKNVTKRESDFFPDWVPFKNKHGDELGEFVAVKQTRLKKRLAPPKHYILKAVADSDDYFDKDQGGGDTEDYFDKKDWSDTNRAVDVMNERKESNRTEFVDIDGIKTIVQHKLAKSRAPKRNKQNRTHKPKTPRSSTQSPKSKRYDEESEYDDSGSSIIDQEKPKPEPIDEKKKEEEKLEEEKKKENEEEKRENEEKRKKILQSVDKLKAIHAAEQNILIEKAKEEEMFREEQERFFTAEPTGKYDPQSESRIKTPAPSFLDDYEDRGDSDKYIGDKYSEIHEILPGSTSTEIFKTTTKKKTTTTPRPRVSVDTGKLSVFRNPQAYMVYDYMDSSDELSPATTKRTTTITILPKRQKEKKTPFYLTNSETKSNSHEEISLVPASSPYADPDEPALFFPKPKKSKKTKRISTTERYATHIAHPVTKKGYDPTGTSFSDSVPSAADTAPSTIDSTPSNKAVYIDADPKAMSHHSEKIKEEKKHENHEHEKGEGREYKSRHEEDRGEHGNKSYEGFHKDQKSSKGHHDKEDHLGKYDDRGGFDKHHHDESAHYGDHEHVEQGKKHAQYEESGKHSKGHSTKGSHDIDKKEEYEKNVVFFEEEGDSAEIEKYGGFKEDKKHERRGEFDHGKSNKGHETRGRGETGKIQKGSHSEQNKDLKDSMGHDRFGREFTRTSNARRGTADTHWIYHHGLPAKTPSLTVIDRRRDIKQPVDILIG